jgi:hypothetical protein
MPVVQQGALNTTALTVPNIYVQIVPPASLTLNGVPSNVLGIVGTATWGPVGVATNASGPSDCTAAFGAIQNRKYDLGTQVATAAMQGANVFKLVRASDGTDMAATVVVQSTCITFNARYTGTLGNTITVQIATGSRGTGYFKAIVTIGGGNTAMPQQLAEVFDNLAFGLTGNAIWVAIAAAINNGLSIRRPASKYITATAGAGTTAPALSTYTLAGGTDGASSAAAVAASPAIILGTDVAPRTGIYALRGTGCALGIVADMDTASAWPTIDALAQSEGIYFHHTSPAGDTVSNFVTTLQTAGLSYDSKCMFGDWVYWLDTVNGLLRLVSPQGFAAGRKANQTPNNSVLNKPLAGVVGTQKSGAPGTTQVQSYAYADLSSIFQAGGDVIGTPSPGGAYFSCLGGHNCSQQPTASDSYTTMTNYIAATLNAGMGKYVGQPITTNLQNNVTATLSGFFSNLVQQGLLTPNGDGSMPYSVVCNSTNNPQSRTSIGYLQADCQVTYEGIVEEFIVNLQGGASVVTTKSSQQTAV